MKIPNLKTTCWALVALCPLSCASSEPGAPLPNAPANTAIGVDGNPEVPSVDNTGPKVELSPGQVVTEPAAATALGAVRPRRLTQLEYTNTLRDLLGVSVSREDHAVDQLAGASGYSTGAAVTTAADVRLILDSAVKLTTGTLSDPSLGTACIADAETGEQRACAERFIAEFGARAFRRPLAADEVSRLLALYDQQMEPVIAADFPTAIRNLVAAMLQSPNFLYRWELGQSAPLLEGSLVRFNSYEMASRLSYALWASMPDSTLFDLAAAEQLSTPEQIEAQARRLLADPRAASGIADFFVQWLNLAPVRDEQKSTDFAEFFSPEVANSMLGETERFINSLFVGPNASGTVEDLLTSSVSFTDESLAKIYGTPGSMSAEFTQENLDPTRRAGLLTQTAFLARHANASESHPVTRGLQVARQLLCFDIPAPPPEVMVGEVEPPEPGVTTRERFAAHGENPCASCHTLFDPLGFAFENYDAVGRYRTEENGQPVDASGSVTLTSGTLAFNNAVELMTILANSAEARACVAKHWFRFLLRREAGPGEQPHFELAEGQFAANSFDMRELIVGIVRSKAFTHRSPALGEML